MLLYMFGFSEGPVPTGVHVGTSTSCMYCLVSFAGRRVGIPHRSVPCDAMRHRMHMPRVMHGDAICDGRELSTDDGQTVIDVPGAVPCPVLLLVR
jgi:hypothetical protein